METNGLAQTRAGEASILVRLFVFFLMPQSSGSLVHPRLRHADSDPDLFRRARGNPASIRRIPLGPRLDSPSLSAHEPRVRQFCVACAVNCCRQARRT